MMNVLLCIQINKYSLSSTDQTSKKSGSTTIFREKQIFALHFVEDKAKLYYIIYVYTLHLKHMMDISKTNKLTKVP